MGEKKWLPIVIFFVVFFLAFGAVYFLSPLLKKSSGFRIDTFPPATVYLDDVNFGLSPFYKEGMEAREYRLRLVAEASGSANTYQTRIKLNEGTLTQLTRMFGPTTDYSSGDLIYLEKTGLADTVSLSVVSDPDGALLKIDGEDAGVAPVSLKGLSEGDHDITIAKPSFVSETVTGKFRKGYDLHVISKLAKSPEGVQGVAPLPGKPPEASASAAPQVLILPTPTGFLRVRQAPSLNATESGQVKPGDKFTLLEENIGWVRIKLASGSGWVSSQYIEKAN